uniref:Uncharacterized protein n=1 Tax=Arundo donax TaxID=35708 RepID=A0A0A8YI73_ARUDO
MPPKRAVSTPIGPSQGRPGAERLPCGRPESAAPAPCGQCSHGLPPTSTPCRDE